MSTFAVGARELTAMSQYSFLKDLLGLGRMKVNFLKRASNAAVDGVSPLTKYGSEVLDNAHNKGPLHWDGRQGWVGVWQCVVPGKLNRSDLWFTFSALNMCGTKKVVLTKLNSEWAHQPGVCTSRTWGVQK